MIYMDNSATTRLKPDCVVQALLEAVNKYSANPGRSGHKASLACAELVLETRKKCAELLGCDEIVFTDNCTGALNLAILGSAMRGGHIVVSCFEHNSVLRCVHALKRRGVISYSVAVPSNGKIDADCIARAIRRNTYAVICSHASNVTGAIADVDGIGRLCTRSGITFIVDGAQSIGYIDVDMKRSGIRLLAFAPHKGLHSVQGVGVLGICGNVKLSPVRFGGTGTNSQELDQPSDIPDGLEIGTLPTPAILALSAAIELHRKNARLNAQRLIELDRFLLNGLCAIDGVTVYSRPSPCGIIAFNVGSLDSSAAAAILDERYDICVRGGLHCAPLTHRQLGTERQGAVRASLGYDNTTEDCNVLISAVREIIDSNRRL